MPSIIFQGRRLLKVYLSLDMAFLFLTFLILALPEGYKAEDSCFRVVGQVNCGSTEYVPVKVQLYDDDDNGKWFQISLARHR